MTKKPNRKQKSRLQIQSKKNNDLQLQALNAEVQRFVMDLYYKDIDEFFIEKGKSLPEKSNIYRLLLYFGFIYNKEEKIWRTENEDLPDNGHMMTLKDLIGIESLIFNYSKEKAEVIEK